MGNDFVLLGHLISWWKNEKRVLFNENKKRVNCTSHLISTTTQACDMLKYMH